MIINSYIVSNFQMEYTKENSKKIVMKAPEGRMKYPNEIVMKEPWGIMKYPNEKVMKAPGGNNEIS